MFWHLSLSGRDLCHPSPKHHNIIARIFLCSIANRPNQSQTKRQTNAAKSSMTRHSSHHTSQTKYRSFFAYLSLLLSKLQSQNNLATTHLKLIDFVNFEALKSIGTSFPYPLRKKRNEFFEKRDRGRWSQFKYTSEGDDPAENTVWLTESSKQGYVCGDGPAKANSDTHLHNIKMSGVPIASVHYEYVQIPSTTKSIYVVLLQQSLQLFKKIQQKKW